VSQNCRFTIREQVSMATAAEVIYPPEACPICQGQLEEPLGVVHREWTLIRCANCGVHRFSREAFEDAPAILRDQKKRAAVAHAIRKRPEGDRITEDELTDLARVAKLPPAMERIDNLVLFMAANDPGTRIALKSSALAAVVGAATSVQAAWAIDQALSDELIAGEADRSNSGEISMRSATLTAKGWKRHTELLRNGAGSRHAFMAMAFNDEMRTILPHLQQAVAATGFELRTTDHPGKTADLIDNRMRVELRTSRFVVVDLTHGNRGAYWEAGFAEGIGRPVFYVCRKGVLEDTDKDKRPHFDAAHQTIVAWDPADPAPGMAELKAMIRATLPDLARMEDA